MNLLHNPELDNFLGALFGNQKERFLSANPEPAAVRINTLRTTAAQFDKRLQELGQAVQGSAVSNLTRIIEPDPLPLSHTLDFFLGRFQYQGLSSQIPALVLNPKAGERVLDMAAAPGSKSTQLAALMENRGSLYVNDLSRQRLQALNANLQKAGALNQVLLHFNGERLGNLFPEYFDKILLDAPCSALGTLASSPEVAGWWSCERLEKLMAIQERLFVAAVKALRPGGELVYSTCSVAPQENDELIQRMLKIYPLDILSLDWAPADTFIADEAAKGAESLPRSLHVYPHLHQMEGFFVVRLRKNSKMKQHQTWKKAAFVKTCPADDPSVKHDLEELAQTYGIDESVWQDYRFIRTRNRLWMTVADNRQVPQLERMASAGLLLAEKKQFMWKLFNQSVQFLGAQIQNRIVDLDDESLKELFATGRRSFEELANGYHVIAHAGQNIASLYVENGKGQIRLPHRFNLII